MTSKMQSTKMIHNGIDQLMTKIVKIILKQNWLWIKRHGKFNLVSRNGLYISLLLEHFIFFWRHVFNLLLLIVSPLLFLWFPLVELCFEHQSKKSYQHICVSRTLLWLKPVQCLYRIIIQKTRALSFKRGVTGKHNYAAGTPPEISKPFNLSKLYIKSKKKSWFSKILCKTLF